MSQPEGQGGGADARGVIFNPSMIMGAYFQSKLSSVATFQCQFSMKISTSLLWRIHALSAKVNFISKVGIPDSRGFIQALRW